LSDLALTIRDLSIRLAAAGIPQARREARLLVAAAAGLPQTALISDPDRKLPAAVRQRLGDLAQRREAHEPLSRILGWREFWSLRFEISPGVLDPRPDSETLVEAVLAWLGPEKARPLRVLDLGTGSGCLLLALLSELPAAEGLGIDLSAAAARIASTNARNLGLAARARFIAGDWGQAVDASFDVVLCNPPYLAEGERVHLGPEVALFDPGAALYGGANGLDAYRALADQLPRLLADHGRAFIELGAGQREAAIQLFASGGLRVMGWRSDLADIPRCLVLAQQKTVGNPFASD
jgi:release factor glutamine methyltransferase